MLADGDMPKALLERPSLKRHLLPVWEAFQALNGDRQMGMSIGPLPFTAVDRYATRYGICGRDEFERFHALLIAMDRVHQQHLAEKMREAHRG